LIALGEHTLGLEMRICMFSVNSVMHAPSEVSSLKKILVIEDDEAHAHSLCRILEVSGYVALCANNAVEARVEVMQRPALILLDLMLPDVNGWALAAEFKANPDLRSIPVVAISALRKEEAEAALAGHSLEAYFTKPLDHDALLEEIRHLLDT
jgi:DNA-binding response OmpR family regulator